MLFCSTVVSSFVCLFYFSLSSLAMHSQCLPEVGDGIGWIKSLHCGQGFTGELPDVTITFFD